MADAPGRRKRIGKVGVVLTALAVIVAAIGIYIFLSPGQYSSEKGSSSGLPGPSEILLARGIEPGNRSRTSSGRSNMAMILKECRQSTNSPVT